LWIYKVIDNQPEFFMNTTSYSKSPFPAEIPVATVRPGQHQNLHSNRVFTESAADTTVGEALVDGPLRQIMISSDQGPA
jgi:hypothetical protein